MAIKIVEPTPPRLLTVDDWVQRYDADQFELIDGFLRARMVNINRHEYAVIKLARILDEYFDRPGMTGGVFRSNTKYRIRARRGIMPDLSVVLGTKLAQIDPDAAYNVVG